jgi:hypothetical protein
VIPYDIVSMKPVIHRKGKEPHFTYPEVLGQIKLFNHDRIEKSIDVHNIRSIDYIFDVVKMEGNVQGV